MSEPQSPPKLSVVDPPPGEVPAAPRRGAGRVLPWLLLAAALVFALLWLNAVEGAQRLEARVSLLDAELSSAHASLAASQAQMDEVRGGIDQVASEIAALRAIAADPDALEGAEPLPAE